MKVRDPHFILEKIDRYLHDNIFHSRVRDSMSIESWKYMETGSDDMISGAEMLAFDDSSWQDFKLYDSWGGYDRVAWFRTTVDVPESWLGKDLVVRLQPGPRDDADSFAEGLLYINERAVQGFDVWHDEAFLDEDLVNQTTLHLALKVWSGVRGIPKRRVFKEAALQIIDKKVDRFFYMAKTMMDVAKVQDDGSLTHIRIKHALNNAFAKINFLNLKSEEYYASIYDALAYLEAELEAFKEYKELKPYVYGVGHSHIDMAWLWRLNATREKASRTFSTVLNLMKQYPNYKFMHTSPQLFKFLEEDYPAIFEDVKKRVESGEFEITGGMWIESDTYVPSGESLIRQFLYGKRYIKEKFNKDTNLLWLPDVFGYSAALPQIIKKSGIDYFMTTKISWNQYNHFPYDTFWWEGLDGSEVFTHFITTPDRGSWFYTYNGKMTPDDVQGIWKNYKNKDINDNLLIAYGWGDGGGGPTREMIEMLTTMENLPGLPYVASSGAEEFFDHLYENTNKEKMDRWVGELYFEYHRGTLTSQARTKRNNRKSEILLHNIEVASVLAEFLDPSHSYPKDQLDTLWERVLLNQFHDILPGSSITEVYEDTDKDYEKIKQDGNAILKDALETITAHIVKDNDSIALYNFTGFERSDYVTIPFGNEISETTKFSCDGKTLSSQVTSDAIIVFVENIPAFSYKTIQLVDTHDVVETTPFTFDEERIQTPFYELKLNAQGEIEYLFDKLNEREVSQGEALNKLVAYEDKPLRFDAWDVDIFYQEKPYEPFTLESRELMENGTERIVVRQRWRFNKSTFTQDLILYSKSARIDFETHVDWHEDQVLLKTYFPVSVRNEMATYEIQHGTLQRPTHRNTEQDMAKFEVSGHRYADLSESDYGVAVLNDCKYGWDIKSNRIGLTLLKSAIDPDPKADYGEHYFTYALFPHAGDFHESSVQEEAIKLNMPILNVNAVAKAEHEDSNPEGIAFVKTDADHIVIDTVKKAEDGEGYIVRLYEFKDRKNTQLRLEFFADISQLSLCNMMEEIEEDLDFNENEVELSISNCEVITLRVKFKQ